MKQLNDLISDFPGQSLPVEGQQESLVRKIGLPLHEPGFLFQLMVEDVLLGLRRKIGASGHGEGA